MLSSYNEVLTVADISEIMLIGCNQVYSLLRSGELKGFRTGKRNWRIPRKNLEEYILQKCRNTDQVCD